MSPVAWFVLLIGGECVIFGVSTIKLVTDIIAASGYASAEVVSGIAGIWFLVCMALGIFTVR